MDSISEQIISYDNRINSKILEENKSQLEFLLQIIDSLDECILVVDIHQNILLTNTVLQNKLRHKYTDLSKVHSCTDIFKQNNYSCHNNKNHCPFEEVRRSKKATKTIHRYCDDNNVCTYTELSITPLYDQNKNIYGYVESRRDITEHMVLTEKLKENKEQLYDLAHHDILTGIPNRRSFLTHLENSIKVAEHNKTEIAILFIDLDNFKQINDTLGHQIGDEVLVITAKRLQGMLRQNDIVCRLGGDEFVIIVESIKTPNNAARLAQKIIDKQSQKIQIKQHELYIKSSIGISIYPDNGLDAESLLQHADTAMYQSKQLGRNTFCFYTQELTDKAFNRMLLEKDLNQAILNNQLVVYYQPQVNLITGKLSGMEAMIRWQHPSKGLLSPDKFIPVAEQSNLIVEIGDWVLKTVCKQVYNWKKSDGYTGRIAINLAGRQLLNEDLIENIKKILKETKCSPNYLEFKITEGFIPHLSDKSIQTLTDLRDMGIDLSIDDFGKGYASLAFLKRLPITRLKIDRSFIQDTGKESPNEDIAKAIIALGNSLDLKVIAEGVEKDIQQELLARAGCQEAQGYLFGHPMDSEHMSDFLNNENILAEDKSE